MRRFSLALILGIAGCGAQLDAQLDPGERVTLAPLEGLLALAIRADHDVGTVELCGEGASPPCVRAGPFETPRALRLLRLPAGIHCITRLVLATGDGTAANSFQGDGESLCTSVRAGVISYPGDLAVDTRPGEFLAPHMIFHARVDVDGLRVMLARRHPDTAERELVTSEWSAMPRGTR